MEDVLNNWNLETLKRHNDKNISGSPERTISRSVIEDVNNDFWLLERLGTKQLERRINIAQNLDMLKSKGLDQAIAYKQDKHGNFATEIMGFYWQLSTFFESDTLPQPEYIYDEVRGENLADFLLKMRSITDSTVLESTNDDLNLLDYAQKLVAKIKVHRPDIVGKLDPICEKLFPLMEKFDAIPKSFVHGDYHPLNILWKKNEVGAVIDWEFCGMRPEIYDVANMVGCVGFENPKAFTKGLIPTFIAKMKESSLDKKSFEQLPVFTAALRFAWLSEWLRKKDEEMLGMELDYMEILLDM